MFTKLLDKETSGPLIQILNNTFKSQLTRHANTVPCRKKS